MNRGVRRHFVTLENKPITTGDRVAGDTYYEPLSPSGAWVSIRPLSPGDNGRTIQTEVEMDYRPEVGLDTRIVFGAQKLYVRGMQDLDYAHVTLRLVCEEAL